MNDSNQDLDTPSGKGMEMTEHGRSLDMVSLKEENVRLEHDNKVLLMRIDQLEKMNKVLEAELKTSVAKSIDELITRLTLLRQRLGD